MFKNCFYVARFYIGLLGSIMLGICLSVVLFDDLIFLALGAPVVAFHYHPIASAIAILIPIILVTLHVRFSNV